MERIGFKLKEAREKQGLSLEDAANKTKIHIDKLRDIENNNFSNSPKVFIKGLIRSYARELKVDKKLVNDLCAQEFDDATTIVPTSAQPPANTIDEDADKRPVGRFQAPKSFFIFFGIVITVVLLSFIYATMTKLNSYSKEESTVETIVFPEAEKNIETSTVDQSTDSNKSIINDENIKKESPLISNQKIISPEKLADLIEPPKEVEQPIKKKIKSLSNKASKKVITEKQEVALEKISNLNKKIETEKKSPTKTTSTVYSDNKLIVEAIEAVRIDIIWSDGKKQVILMKEKEKKTFIFSNPLKVGINNGGAVNIYFNNKFLGVPGTLNSPIELKYP